MFEILISFFLNQFGTRLALPDNCVLPGRCAICNRAVEGPLITMRIESSTLLDGNATFTVHLHLCKTHRVFRRMVMIVSAVAAIGCAFVVGPLHDGQQISTLKYTALFSGFVFLAILLNSIFNDTHFRGICVVDGRMNIKGFGSAFIKSLRPGEIMVDATVEDPAPNRRDQPVQKDPFLFPDQED